MSSFACEVVRVKIEKHPDPEVNKIELVKVGGYTSIATIGKFKTGDLAVYIPEAAIVPLKILEELSLVGRLAGSEKNRVKAIKLRGVVSQGLVYPADPSWAEGTDVSEILGVKKWEPPIPAGMKGEVMNSKIKCAFDLENIKKFPDTFNYSDNVYFTEKLHGTCQIVGWVKPELATEDMFDGCVVVGSKGLSKQGLFFKDNEANKNNLYVRTAKKFDLISKIQRMQKSVSLSSFSNFFLLGETFGKGVQDLTYGCAEPEYRAFGIMVGENLLDFEHFLRICEEFNIPTVPVLYYGPYSHEEMIKHTSGKNTLSLDHIREGIVVVESHSKYNEKPRILKSVSDDYLFRGGNPTELT